MAGFATYPSLKDRVVFITGGASGIGATFVTSFHEQGAKVAFVDLKQADGDALMSKLGGNAWFQTCDVTDADALQGAIAAAGKALGDVTVLINNVANDTRQVTAEMTPQAWRKDLAVNLDPVFIASHAVYPMMKRAGGGVIVNVSSINALLGPEKLAGYVAAKGGINSLSKTLAREWGVDGVRVNALSPGWVVTPRQLELWLTPEAEAEWMKQVALKTRILPEDIARLALFLASDDSRMITGQNIVIDGGRT
ncbi:SDR family NAD(P)-dependent oxidoreductase [Phenylobacterium soli]|uniref:D-xylose 1-dehydrogenase n=1 Tax=Phenylobacterium soli TaxID=2170551 RepID=A0A328ANA8_9CAUL|nr:SDR family NAD(P)-dependent oxidoreductase [Phenylobacterium soli]RAK55815.1 3-oxoacyl-ACP reductase [Phenylobacterium soli]